MRDLVRVFLFLAAISFASSAAAQTVSSIAITPATISTAKGKTQTFKALATMSNGTKVYVTHLATWSSSNGNAVVLPGLVSGTTASTYTKGVRAELQGTAVISANYGGRTGSANMTITAPVATTVTVSPASATVPLLGTQQFTASGTMSDGTTQDLTNSASWTSSSTAIATVGNTTGSKGLATGKSNGTVTITATSGAIKGTASFTNGTPVVNPRLLTVSVTGATSGRVISNPSGIACGSNGTTTGTNCTYNFELNSTVQLTAQPVAGATFAGWSGGCTGTALTCNVLMSTAKTVTASFKNMLTVSKAGDGAGTVTSSPIGISCGTDCSEPYVATTSVRLTATATTGSRFTGWAGACSGTLTSCTLLMSQARNAIANFASNNPLLTVTRSGAGTGAVTSSPTGISCGTDCTQNYTLNTNVVLTATPASGSVFTGWSGACTNASGTCSVAMSQAKTVNANFSPAQFALNVSRTGTGSGSVSSTPAGISCGVDCSENFNNGTLVQLTAAAAADSDFTGWTGACSGSASTCSVTMSQARNVTASFTLKRFQLAVSLAGSGSGTVSSSPAGISCGADCSEDYEVNTIVTLTAAANANSDFSGWSGACSGTAATCSVTMSQARSVTANFEWGPPTAVAQSLRTNEDTALLITLDGNDPGGRPLSYTITKSPTHGTLTGGGAVLQYVPALNFNGADVLSFKVTNGLQESTAADININVIAVNDPPVLEPSAEFEVSEGYSLAFVLHGSDVDGDSLRYASGNAPDGMVIGETNGAVSWTPGYLQAGNYPIEFKVRDQKGLEGRTVIAVTVTDAVAPLVSLYVTPDNPAPLPLVSPGMQLAATAQRADLSSVDVTTDVSWSSDNTAIAIVNPQTGLVTAINSGSTVIRAIFGGLEGSREIQVVDYKPRIAIVHHTSEGTLLSFTVDPVTGQLRARDYIDSEPNQNNAIVHPNNKWVYSFTNSGVRLHRIDFGGKFQRSWTQVTPGLGVTRGGTIDPSGRYMYFARENTMFSINGYSIGVDGALSPLPGFPLQPSVGETPNYFFTDRNGQFLYWIDFRMKNVHAYRINKDSGSIVSLGPVHTIGGYQENVRVTAFAVGADGRSLVASTSDGYIHSSVIDPQSGTLSAGGFLYTTLGSITAIAPHPGGNGLFFTVSRDGVAAIRVANTGAMTQITAPEPVSDIPISATVDPQGKHLYVTGRNTLCQRFTVDSTGSVTAGELVLTHPFPGDIAIIAGEAPIRYVRKALYTGSSDPMKGIGQHLLNDSGSVSSTGPALPTFAPVDDVIIDPQRPFLYGMFFPGTAGMARFAIRQDESLVQETYPNVGGAIRHGVMDLTGRAFFAARTDDNLVRYDVSPTGSFSNPQLLSSWVPQWLSIHPNGRYGYAVGLYGDIRSFRQYYPGVPWVGVDSVRGELLGSEGQDLVLHPNGRFGYVVHRRQNNVALYRVANDHYGALTAIMAQAAPVTNARSFVIHPSGSFAYLVGEGDQRVAMYSIDPLSGALSPLAPHLFTMSGIDPDSARAAVDPEGKFLVIGHTGSRTLTVLSIDPETGDLSEVPGSPFLVEEAPVDLVFTYTVE